MKVVRKTRQPVAFRDLEIGDQFEWGGDLYVKTSDISDYPNAVRLSNQCGTAGVALIDNVHPVTIELHVFDKE